MGKREALNYFKHILLLLLFLIPEAGIVIGL